MNLDAAKFLGKCCQATYEMTDDLVPSLPQGYTVAATFRANNEPFAFLATSADDSVLAFRGTDSAMDWVMDGVFTQVEFGGGLVHAGGLALYLQMRNDLLKHQPKKITGHSLGGMLATFAAYDFPSATCYTFAAPRAGDVAFADALDAKTQMVRVVNVFDLIPHLPPFEIPDPIQGRMAHFAHAGKQHSVSFFHGMNWHKNHAIENYLAALDGETAAQAA